MMTYAGYALTLPTEKFMPILQRWWDEQAPELWSHPGYSLEQLHYLPVPDRPKQRRARLNVLYWPSCASRWGVFHGLVSGPNLTRIQAQTGGTISTPIAQNLVIKDEQQNKTVTASMFLLAARPIFSFVENQELYWITLVDKRYYAWLKQLDYTISPGDSWADLIQNLSTAAGLPSPTVSTVNANYGDPNEDRWTAVQRPLPLLLDAACQQVGLRYVIALSGATSKALNFSDAQTIDLANYEDNDTAVIAGGRNTVANIIGNVPANVSVSFWSATTTPTIVNVSLASLALTHYSGLTGVSGAYGFFGVDQEDTVVSPTQADAADIAATDYYYWLLSLNDVVFRSVRVLNSSGLEDCIEWEYVSAHFGCLEERSPTSSDPDLNQSARITTRIVPLDWSDKSIYAFSPPGNGSGPVTPEKPWITLTETSGPSSWQGRYVDIPSGTWGNSPDSGTNDIRPCQIDGGTFLPKPTASALKFSAVWSGDANSGPGYLPIQYADRVSSVDYPGYVSTGAQLWNGNKTFADYVVVNYDINSGTLFNVLHDNGGSQPAFTVSAPGTPISPGTPTSNAITLGGGGQSYITAYGQYNQSMVMGDSNPSDAWRVDIYGYPSGGGTLSYNVDATGNAFLTLTKRAIGNPSVDLFCGGVDVLGIYGASGLFWAAGGRFDNNCYSTLFSTYDISVGVKNGGTLSDGMGDFIFLNGLYIAGGVTGSFP